MTPAEERLINARYSLAGLQRALDICMQSGAEIPLGLMEDLREGAVELEEATREAAAENAHILRVLEAAA